MKDIPRATHCRLLKNVSYLTKPVKKPLLTARYKLKCLDWCRKYMKLDFSNVIFTDESRVTLDGPDGWRRGWVLNECRPTEIIRRQQGDGGINNWHI